MESEFVFGKYVQSYIKPDTKKAKWAGKENYEIKLWQISLKCINGFELGKSCHLIQQE